VFTYSPRNTAGSDAGGSGSEQSYPSILDDPKLQKYFSASYPANVQSQGLKRFSYGEWWPGYTDMDARSFAVATSMYQRPRNPPAYDGAVTNRNYFSWMKNQSNVPLPGGY
jgi:hypothetical protein